MLVHNHIWFITCAAFNPLLTSRSHHPPWPTPDHPRSIHPWPAAHSTHLDPPTITPRAPIPDQPLTAPTPEHPQSTHPEPPARRPDCSTAGPPLLLTARAQTSTYQMEGGHVSGPQSPTEAWERNPSRPGSQVGQENSRPPWVRLRTEAAAQELRVPHFKLGPK